MADTSPSAPHPLAARGVAAITALLGRDPPVGDLRLIFTNAASLVGTTLVTSVLGVGFWWVAAHSFTPAAVGLGSAAISAIMLIATISTLGLGTFLMGELPRRAGQASSLVPTCLTIAGCVALVLGGGFALLSPRLSSGFASLGNRPVHVAVFAFSAALTAVGLVMDQSLVGMLRAHLQLQRNAIFAVVKLAVLALAGAAVGRSSGLSIYAAWGVGVALSLSVVTLVLTSQGVRPKRPRFRLIRGLGRSPIEHHAFNLALQVPGLVLPVVVAAVLTPAVNSRFYVALMIAGFVWMVPIALATVLFPSAVGKPDTAPAKIRFTVCLSMLFGIAASIVVFFGARRILEVFGSHYANGGAWPLRLLVLQVFPVAIKTHYAAVTRISRRIGRAIPFVWGGTALEVALAIVGLEIAGLVGLAVGWLAALLIEAVLMARPVARGFGADPLPDRTAKAEC